jgi:thiol-disulfide isomerase/thioredoxin
MKAILKILLPASLLSFTAFYQKVEPVTLAQLRKQTENKINDTLYIVNFWATWCKPCVQEMPFFIEADKKFSSQKVKVIFVSLNSLKELPGVEKFVSNNNIQNPVCLLNAGNPNDWIDKIDNTWSGSIPATCMYKKGKKIFFKEGGLTQTELEQTISDKNK